MAEFGAAATLEIESVEGADAAFSEPVSVPMAGSPAPSQRRPSSTMAGSSGGPSLTSLAEDRNETLVELLDEIESGGGVGGSGGGGGGILGGLGLVQLAAAGSAGAGLAGGLNQNTGEDQQIGPLMDRLIGEGTGTTEGEAARATRERLFGQEEAPIDIDPDAIGSEIATTFTESVEYPALPDLSSSAEWPDLPALSSSVDWPAIPDPGGMDYWPDIPEPEDIGIDVPPALEEFLGGGNGGGSTRPDSSVPNNLRNPGGASGGGALDVNISDFAVDIPSAREVEREIEEAATDAVEDYLQRQLD